MPTDSRRANEYLRSLLSGVNVDQRAAALAPRHGEAPPRVPGGARVSSQAVDQRWALPGLDSTARDLLWDAQTQAQAECYQHNIEHLIGTVKVPVGLAGPLRVNGLFARGDYYVPLATTEAALVASYGRGACMITEAGGCTAILLNEGVSRVPGFAFESMVEAGQFIIWATASFERFKEIAGQTTRHGKLIDLRITLEGNHVYLGFEYSTGDAAGQNMVTIATWAVCQYIEANSPVKPAHWFVEANMSGDKKASAQSFLGVRGKKVSAEVRLGAELVRKRLHTTPQQMVRYWQMSAMGGVLSGAVGIQGHYANGLAALYLACGQDVACVAESATGVTRMELTDDGALYTAVTLPNLIVGTVGGGTKLPTQQACLNLLGLAGAGHARALAEVCAAVALAGELSIIGALAAGHFARAHEHLSRGRKPAEPAPQP